MTLSRVATIIEPVAANVKDARMYGFFHPGRPIGSLPPGLETVFDDPSIRLLKKHGSSFGRLHRKGHSVLYLFGELYNVQDVWPASDGSGDDWQSLHELAAGPRLLEALPRLNGSFLLVAYDEAAGRVLLIGDRYGSQKCFYAFRDGCLAFFPHVHYFLDMGYRARLDEEFLFQFLTFKWIVGDRTVLDGVFAVPPGTVVEACGAGVKLHKYWSWHFDESRTDLDDPDAEARRLGTLLLESVERRVRGKSRLVLPLSGGLDSRATLGAVLACKPAESLLAVTYGTPGTFDYELGRLVAQSAGVAHRHIDLTQPRDYDAEYLWRARDTDGQVDVLRTFLSDWAALRDFSEHMVVGFMGDVLSGRRLPREPLSERPSDERAALRPALKMRRFVPAEVVGRLLDMEPQACHERALDCIAQCNTGNDQRLLGNYVKHWDLPTRQVKFTMVQVYKLREDFNYIAPFLDNAYVDFSLRVPLAWRVGQKLYKRMLVGHSPALYALPTKNLNGLSLRAGRWSAFRQAAGKALRRAIEKASLGAIPVRRNLRERLRWERLSYIDYTGLMRTEGPFQAMCADKLARLAHRGALNGETVLALWHEHAAGDADHTHALILLVSLEFIFEAFADRRC